MILLMGIAGSGKGTQGQLLADKFGYKMMSMGDVIRSQASPEQLEYISTGNLLSDEDTQELLLLALGMAGDVNKIILDGFPRTVAQAEWLLAQYFTITAAVHLDASETAVKGRLLERGRKDDVENVIARRFDAYRRQTFPVLEYLRAHDVKVMNINAEQSVKDVNKDILTALALN